MSETSTLHCAVRPPEITPDLDIRPGEPVRSTLRDWLQACGTCHAAGPDLSALPPGAKAAVQLPAYSALSLEAAEQRAKWFAERLKTNTD